MGKGSPEQFLSEVQQRIAELGGGDIAECTAITGSDDAWIEDKIKNGMRGWRLTLDKSIAERLRSAIRNEDAAGTKDALLDACESLKELDEDLEYDMEDLEDELSLHDPDEDDFEESIDYVLDNFYDICDANRIWIPITM